MQHKQAAAFVASDTVLVGHNRTQLLPGMAADKVLHRAILQVRTSTVTQICLNVYVVGHPYLAEGAAGGADLSAELLGDIAHAQALDC